MSYAQKDCPIRSLYWAFLERHRDKLQGNHRLAVPLASAAKRSEDQQLADRRVFEWVGSELRAGRAVLPAKT